MFVIIGTINKRTASGLSNDYTLALIVPITTLGIKISFS